MNTPGKFRHIVSAQSRAFSLVELLVVITIIAMLIGIVLAKMDTARLQGREAKRKSDIKQLQIALQLYYVDHGNYPAGCWRYLEANGEDYIPGLAPTYIAKLPHDPSGGTCPSGIGNNSNLRTYYYCSDGHNKYKLNVCSETVIPNTSEWYDPIRPGYAWMICSSQSACTTF